MSVYFFRILVILLRRKIIYRPTTNSRVYSFLTVFRIRPNSFSVMRPKYHKFWNWHHHCVRRLALFLTAINIVLGNQVRSEVPVTRGRAGMVSRLPFWLPSYHL
jgi:hypothetical protein